MSLLEDDQWEHCFHLQCRPPWTIRAFNPSRPWLGWLGYYQLERTWSQWHGVRKIPLKMEVEKWEGATMTMMDIVQRGHSTCAALAWLGPGCHHWPPGKLRDHKGDTGDLFWLSRQSYSYFPKIHTDIDWKLQFPDILSQISWPGQENRLNCTNIWTTTQFYRPVDKWQQCCWIDYYPSL